MRTPLPAQRCMTNATAHAVGAAPFWPCSVLNFGVSTAAGNRLTGGSRPSRTGPDVAAHSRSLTWRKSQSSRPCNISTRHPRPLREMGLMPEKIDPAPINALLEKISDLDKDKIALIARTLGQAEVFNEVVREQTSKMEIGERYQDDHQRLQLDPRRLQAAGRPGRRRQDRHPRARHQHVDEDRARRHRRPLRQDPQDLSRRHQGNQEPDRARGQDPRRLSRLSRRAEACRGHGAGGAQEGRGRSSMRPRRT